MPRAKLYFPRRIPEPKRMGEVEKLERLLREKDERFWQKAGEKRALEIFHEAARRVPAYRRFLKIYKVNPEKIKSVADFRLVPWTNVKNYTNKYSLSDRSWDGNLCSAKLIAASSGTSGEPKFWPRGAAQDLEATIIHELLYRNLFQINKYRTLLVICFPMGIYVSGVATLLPSWFTSLGKYDLTIVSAGNNKIEVLRAVKNLKDKYEQVLLIGHPFFIKDVVETGRRERISWSRCRLKMLFCSEGFSENWRRYLLNRAGLKDGPRHIFNTYGSSEMLLMAYETPTTVLLRNILDRHGKARNQLLDTSTDLPNLFQYNPLWRFIESNRKNELIFTSDSGLPLVRYNLHDSGRVISFAVVEKLIQKFNKSEVLTGWHLPLVALWGRSDQTIIFYAANIYPEHIKYALDQRPFFNKLTGKFTMRKDYLPNMDQYLEVNVELRSGVRGNSVLQENLQTQIVEILKRVNHEYADTFAHHPTKDLKPRIVLWPYQSEKYFKLGLKPKYII